MKCPKCDAKLKRMITADPHIDHQLVEGWECPECGYELAEWWLRQLRSADESEVRFFRCVKCGKTWREYD